MRKIDITRGDQVAMRIELHDPELNVVVHEEITSEPSPYKFKKGDRVRNLKESEGIKKGATGTVDGDNSNIPYVLWDSEEMLTEAGKHHHQWKKNHSLSRGVLFLELITEPEIKPIEVSDAHSSLVLDDLQHRVSGEGLEMAQPDYSHLIGKWFRYCLQEYKDSDFFGKWAQIKSVETVLDSVRLVLESNPLFDDYAEYEGACFDLSNPRDTNPDEPVETRIPFDIARYDSGDFLRYETRDGREVKCVVLNDVENEYPVTGYLVGEKGPFCFNTNGNSGDGFERISDLFMVIKGGEE